MRSDHARLSLFTAASFAVLGVHLPFWPKWLEARGMSTEQIGAIGAAWAVTRGITTPVWAHFVDMGGRRKLWSVALAFGALFAFAPFVALHTFQAFLALTVVFCILHAAVLPLGENLIVLFARERGFSYGAVRMWGSISFVAVSWIAGLALSDGHVERAYLLVMICLAAGALAACAMPSVPSAPRSSTTRLPIGELLRRPAVVAALAGSGIVQASHATYYVFSTLHWTKAGHSTGVVGALWAEGVVAEVLLFAAASRLRARFNESMLMWVAVLGGCARWIALALSTDLYVLVGAQWLHALSFSAAHVATMSFIASRVPAEHSASAQSLYGAFNIASHALALACVTKLFADHGGAAFWPMIGVALLGGTVAMWGMRRAPALA